MAKICVDNVEYEVPDGRDLLHTCLSLGLDLPYFCWHPAMGSVGACRQCAVKLFKDESDTRGRLVMACMTPADEGTRISIQDAEAVAFRASVTEWMMVNHPHDCPICDEGGECHLQDMTVMTGHNYRHYRGNKRTFHNQDLGPLVNQEMNRCIQCYRCVRFYRDYAGGRDFNSFALRNQVFFGRKEDGTLENEFSGNLVEVCPTGVFTDKSFKEHFTRKWDLQTAPSICVNCAVGCNTIPGERYGQLRRIRNRYNHEVNGYFLCDRGRYGYEFVNSPRRIRHPAMRAKKGEAAVEATRAEALERLKEAMGDGQKVIGIGSPRASLEANFALRTLVGPERFFTGFAPEEAVLVSEALRILQGGPARSPSLHDIQEADAVFLLGEDVTNTAPMMALALRQAVRNAPRQAAARARIPAWNDAAVREIIQEKKGPLFVATVGATKLEEIATESTHGAVEDLARLGMAVARAITSQAPEVADLAPEVRELAGRIAQALKDAERPLVLAGTGCGSQVVIQAAANVAYALCAQGRPASLGFVLPESNSTGLGLMGGKSLAEAVEQVKSGATETVLLLENDLYRRLPPADVDALFAGAKTTVVLDVVENGSTQKADVVLPAASFAEGNGTLVSSEGRAQRFYQVFTPEGEVDASWHWLRDLATTLEAPAASTWSTPDEVAAALAQALPVFAPLLKLAPPADFRIAGERIPRQPHRYSGRTAMHANVSVHEPRPPQDTETPLSFSMEGFKNRPPAALIDHYWSPGWNSVQSLNKFQQEVNGPLTGGDPGSV